MTTTALLYPLRAARLASRIGEIVAVVDGDGALIYLDFDEKSGPTPAPGPADWRGHPVVWVESGADHLVVRGGRPVAARLDSHGDHRVAMAGAIAANALEGESFVHNWRAVTSSYPEFTEDLATLTGRAAL